MARNNFPTQSHEIKWLKKKLAIMEKKLKQAQSDRHKLMNTLNKYEPKPKRGCKRYRIDRKGKV